MSAERWQLAKAVFQAALDRPDLERADFLTFACGGDADLRREVDSLLASHQNAQGFLSNPAGTDFGAYLEEPPVGLSPGSRLGPYEIVALLGKGGMGEVYRARDTRLGRDVAIKILPVALSGDPDRLRRFEQEARAASALNHPNILTVHDVGKLGSAPYITMELIEGKTLRGLLAAGPVATRRLLAFAAQLAAGLAKAHSAGIVHRDLKPENVMVTSDGVVRILDFGLARHDPPPGEPGKELGVTVHRDTEPGTVMGTAGYMSPEQAAGRMADFRSDQFSLGAILYELATGHRAFQGVGDAETLAAILRDEPKSIATLNPLVPAPFQWIVERCLAKDPEERSTATRELARELETLRDRLVRGEDVSAEPRRRDRPTGLAIVTLVGVAIAGAAWLARGWRASREAAAPPRTVPLTSFSGDEVEPALSPDGKQVAFAWDRGTGGNADIYIKLVDAGTPLRLTTDPASDRYPAWSPDGRYIAFLRFSRSERAVFIVPALGGPERKPCALSGGADRPLFFPIKNDLAWSPDGKFLAVPEAISPEEPSSIFLVSVETGEKRRLTSPPAHVVGDTFPAFSPDGATLAFLRSSTFFADDVYRVAISGGEPRRLTFEGRAIGGLSWNPDGGDIIFASTRGGSRFKLWRIPASGGEPEALTVGGEDASEPTLSGRRLAYVHSALDPNIWRIAVPASGEPPASPTRLIASTRYDFGPQFSSDGKRIAFTSDRGGDFAIWVCQSDGSNLVQLTSFSGVNVGTPRWSPNGMEIAFDASLQGHRGIYVVGSEGGQPRPLSTEGSNDGVASWSHDGRWIYFSSDRTGTNQVWKTAWPSITPAAFSAAYRLSGLDRELKSSPS